MTTTTLFGTGRHHARLLAAADVPALQAFFDANPEYFVTVGGEPPGASEAQTEFDDAPPAGMPFKGRCVIGFDDHRGAMAGMAHVLTDFLADGVGHIGLFIVASALHGRGVGGELYRGLEDWMRRGGMRWIRLGAVVGNEKAERFWVGRGYHEVRRRHGIVMGQRTNDLHVYVKALQPDATVADYLARVERDRPESVAP